MQYQNTPTDTGIDGDKSETKGTSAIALRVHQAVQAGHLPDALLLLEEQLAAEPTNADAWHLQGSIFLSQQEFDFAVKSCERAAVLAPQNPAYHLHLAIALQELGDHRNAVLRYERALRLDATLLAAWLGLSEILLAKRQLAAGLECLKQVLTLDARNVAGLLLLGNVQQNMQDLAAAQRSYRAALEIDPNHSQAAVNLASLLRRDGNIEEALQWMELARSSAPDCPLIQFNSANLFSECGDFLAAEQAYRQALPSHPRPAKVIYNLSTIHRFQSAEQSQIEHWAQQLEEPEMNIGDQSLLHFAVAKAHDDLQQYDRAFAHYRRGNQLAHVDYVAEAQTQLVDRTCATWTREWFENHRVEGSFAAAPVFIVGLPRSGTSLLEQVLSAHSQIHSLGERETLGATLADFGQRSEQAADALGLAEHVTHAELAVIATKYFRGITVPESVRYLTDKMPSNFLLLGWIAACFPAAQVIHCRRDPRDVCLSAYFQHFRQPQPFAYDLNHLVHYHREYQRLMDHWRAVLPISMVEVNYEELVSDFQTTTQRVLAQLALDWEPGCAEAHHHARQVKTASHWQVRQPVHTRSIGRWENYREFIPELIAAFGDGPLPKLSDAARPPEQWEHMAQAS